MNQDNPALSTLKSPNKYLIIPMKYFSRHLYISIQTEIFSAICHTKRDFPRLSCIKTLFTTQQRTSKIYSLLFLKYQILTKLIININRYQRVEQKTEVISTISDPKQTCMLGIQIIYWIHFKESRVGLLISDIEIV